MIQAKFNLGQVVVHSEYGYRGVIVDVDSEFTGTDDLYGQMASRDADRDVPWYHILIDEYEHETYVAETCLEADTSSEPVSHPDLDVFFDGFSGQAYTTSRWTYN